MYEPRYIIGIDLGTTNSVVAYTKATVEKGEKAQIHVLDILQLTGPGVLEKRSVLPSFVLLPKPHEVSPESLRLPWKEDNQVAVGEFARERGAELPQRLIFSAKSWLCHTLVDRNAAILPWDADEDQHKLSPVEASSLILEHLKNAWDYTMAGEDESLKMERQEIFLTVPASFDAVARELTVNAAKMAGLENVTLLEEPQSAFYAWIEANGDRWRERVEKGDLVLVCDVGGGTSDFSLIRVSEEGGELDLERIAVGDHLLVGGDNMDLALAYALSGKLSGQGKKIDSWQMRGLWQSCRKAKEKMFATESDSAEPQPVTILGRGSGLIGGAIRTELDMDTISDTLLEGFFPRCGIDDRPVRQKGTGIREFGLSYESDPAISRHIAYFLNRRKKEDQAKELPTAILFNGGVMKAAALRRRIQDIISTWTESGEGLREIQTDEQLYDLAVARGAAYYGLARKGKGIRIRGGLNRSYYIGIAASMPAVPGMSQPIRALCIAPFGMEEGTQAYLKDREFVLVVGEPAKFDFLGSVVRLEDGVGTIVDDWEDEIEPITTLETTLEGEHGQAIPVNLEIWATEIGTIEIWCVSTADGKKWKLEFNVRERESFESD